MLVNTEDLISVPEFAKLEMVTPMSIYKRVNNNTIKHVVICKSTFIFKSEIGKVGKYKPVKCSHCEWEGSSKYLKKGTYCPCCKKEVEL